MGELLTPKAYRELKDAQRKGANLAPIDLERMEAYEGQQEKHKEGSG